MLGRLINLRTGCQRPDYYYRATIFKAGVNRSYDHLSVVRCLSVRRSAKKLDESDDQKLEEETLRNGLINRPSPPRLGSEEQREFERLVRRNNLTSTVDSNSRITTKSSAGRGDGVSEVLTTEGQQRPLQLIVDENLMRVRGEEFEGDVNPRTGEVGGPRRDPLKWQGEWSYGGRATDF
ncbi:hypothetical protein PPACK8108_LOCUS4614 [Phakopsora pachyrhizi]|uniref:Succinate dehydrogenase assembly factor 4, mitochondrial n=1 Tax=Phakopsora pachyrhizi TaxID=170000 RepID=I6UWD1_PHAPC|nr:hypothetical protein [Phakopsora pachyrhizi]CAH7669947.1 hypothetical protein PPACK8108_LOCUS4614 [Phakopsora pachyrhizi]